MDAAALKCPMCGAAARTDSTHCEHCGARLATVACPRCFGLIFVGARHCSHCGALAAGAASARSDLRCPRCDCALEGRLLGDTDLHECPQCSGLWASVEALDHIQKDREQQSAVLGFARPLEERPGGIEPVRYVPCPVCRKLMNRVNFARCSKVVVDICKGHGTWFDRDELRRIIEFIQSGGLDLAREKEKAELEEKRRALENARNAPAYSLEDTTGGLRMGIFATASGLKNLLR